MNLFQQLMTADADRPFITAPDGSTLSYGDIDGRSSKLAGALMAAGAEHGDRVLLQIDKSPDAVALVLACLRANLVFVPINTAYTADEVAFFASDTGASVFVCVPEREAELAQACGDAVRILTLDQAGSGSLADHTAQATAFNQVIDLDEHALAAMLYTSGTTGRSKGAMLTHASLLANAHGLREVWNIEASDIVLHTLPVFHVHGLFVAIFPTMLVGASLIFCPRFDVDVVLEQLPNATVLMGVPTHYIRLLAHPGFGPTQTEALRLFTSGSAPMTEAVHQQFTERTGRHIVERYGMTETGILSSNPLGGGQVAGSVGFALPGHALRVVDEAGAIADADVTGLVEAKLPVDFAGYWQLPDKTAETITDDGWFRTGDVGYLDADQRLWLDGRASDMIISGGYNVYPKEIEMVLDEVPGVGESAVVGVAHPDFGEGVVAVIATNDNTDQVALEAALREACVKPLARFKHPKHYLFVESLPRNAMAKVQKKALRVEHANLFATE